MIRHWIPLDHDLLLGATTKSFFPHFPTITSTNVRFTVDENLFIPQPKSSGSPFNGLNRINLWQRTRKIYVRWPRPREQGIGITTKIFLEHNVVLLHVKRFLVSQEFYYFFYFHATSRSFALAWAGNLP